MFSSRSCNALFRMIILSWSISCADGGLNHYRRHMQQARKTTGHSSIINSLNRDKCRRVRDLAEKSWDEHLYGHDRSVIEDEDQITRMLMSKDSLAEDAARDTQQLFIGGQLVAGAARPAMPMDQAADLPIPKRPPWVRGVTDKAALVKAEQVRIRRREGARLRRASTLGFGGRGSTDAPGPARATGARVQSERVGSARGVDRWMD
jgi:hypothetical protein